MQNDTHTSADAASSRGRKSTVGFIGLGVMGQPMALNLARAGAELVVWNRTPTRSSALADAGALVVGSVEEVFEQADTVILMLVNESITDQVLGRGQAAFKGLVAGHLVVSTGSVSVDYSRHLAADIDAAGGRFVEAPVSGSRGPAEAGTLVALLGGSERDIVRAAEILAPTTTSAIPCGDVGTGQLMKMAVNHYLSISVAALAEAANFASRQGLPLPLFRDAILAGPLASGIAHVKLDQLVAADFEVRAAAEDALASTRLALHQAERTDTATPLLQVASDLFTETVERGLGRRDMIAVIEAISNR